MKIVKIKMLRNFRDESGYDILNGGETYFAIDGGDYWAVQSAQFRGFNWVVPKIVPEKIVPTTTYAEVVAE